MHMQLIISLENSTRNLCDEEKDLILVVARKELFSSSSPYSIFWTKLSSLYKAANMPFSTTAIRALKDIVEAAVIPENGGVPGITAVVFDKAGNELFVHSAGTRGASSIDVLTPEHVFWIASCTKMLTALSIMQLVERGRVSLDDSQQLEELCPELRKVQVLRDDGILEPKRRGITLRMLLTHTSGLGYGFHEKLRYYGYSDLIDEFSGRLEDLEMPLVFHPGEGWEYGASCMAMNLTRFAHR